MKMEKSGTVIKGADGELYFLPNSVLQAHKLSQADANKLAGIRTSKLAPTISLLPVDKIKESGVSFANEVAVGFEEMSVGFENAGIGFEDITKENAILSLDLSLLRKSKAKGASSKD
jgi:hypothetical protein